MSDSSRSDPVLTLVQYPGLTQETTLSPPCAKARMALAVKGLSYTIKNVGMPSEIRRYNPRCRVPVLLIGSEVIVDSTDIVTEIDRRHPTPPLEPAEPVERARGRILEDWADEVLYFYGLYLRWCLDANYARMRALVLSRLPIPGRWIAPLIARRELRRRAVGQGVGTKDEATVCREMRESLESIVTLLGASPFLFGSRLTRADLALAAVLDQLNLPQLTPQGAAAVRSHPEILSWLDRVHLQAPDLARPPARDER